jgi:uncharacterized membrane protein (UPF0127 family)
LNRRALSLFAVLLCAAEPQPARCVNAQLPPEIERGARTATAPATRAPGALRVVTLEAPKASLVLAVAADERSRELGLMCETDLREHAGMLFVFERDRRQEFWMKNTLIPLDMVWVRTDGTVDTVAANVPASTVDTPDERVARATGRRRYVIELRAGEAADDGIVRGGKLTLPQL